MVSRRSGRSARRALTADRRTHRDRSEGAGGVVSGSASSSGRLGEYPTDEGGISDAGRRQQVVVAVWVLGWLGGPLPALMALVVTRPRATQRTMILAALGFWTAVALAAVGLVVVAADRVGWLLAGWATLAVVTLVVTALAVRRALRGV